MLAASTATHRDQKVAGLRDATRNSRAAIGREIMAT
jgi:hypothetical protein